MRNRYQPDDNFDTWTMWKILFAERLKGNFLPKQQTIRQRIATH